MDDNRNCIDMEERCCQNCKNDFVIDEEDFAFYEKIKVPPPTFCRYCRYQRRGMFRNERCLYRRNCDLCQKSMVSVFAPEKPHTVYCEKCWWSDDWDPMEYGMEYDPNRNFFEQLKELSLKVPLMNRIIDHSSVVNSDYINHAGACKNCTLLFNADYCENIMYSATVVHSHDALDLYACDNVSLCYDITDGEGSSRCFFGQSLVSCVDTYFSRDCTGCINCFGCINLRNKSYHVFNQEVSPEKFKEIVASYKLHTREGVERAKKDTEEFFLQHPRRLVYGQKNVDVRGNYVYHSKNAKDCWSGQYYEDCAYCQLSTLPYTRDTYDMTEWGANAERCYDCITVGEGASGVKFCFGSWNNTRDTEYCFLCTGGISKLFGCVSLRKKGYCILNRQYTKEEYETLRKRIIQDLEQNPYIDLKGRIFKYGEFMPYDLSFFDYNETYISQYFPLDKEAALAAGFRWRDETVSAHTSTIHGLEIPSSIHEVNDSILQEIIACATCGKPYKILVGELELLRRLSLPLHASCSDCRHMTRVQKIGDMKLHERNCDKCSNVIMSAYAPDRPEIVYCESCYQQEIA